MKKAMRIFCRDLRRLIHSPAAMLVMAGVAILPSLYAWFNIAANIDPYANTSAIQIAVANNDQDASTNDLTINAGDQQPMYRPTDQVLHFISDLICSVSARLSE